MRWSNLLHIVIRIYSFAGCRAGVMNMFSNACITLSNKFINVHITIIKENSLIHSNYDSLVLIRFHYIPDDCYKWIMIRCNHNDFISLWSYNFELTFRNNDFLNSHRWNTFSLFSHLNLSFMDCSYMPSKWN